MKHIEKQAYLILAHRDDFVFYTLLSLLDKPFNDIFIHRDKKNRSYDSAYVESKYRTCQIYHTKRTKVTWGVQHDKC